MASVEWVFRADGQADGEEDVWHEGDKRAPCGGLLNFPAVSADTWRLMRYRLPSPTAVAPVLVAATGLLLRPASSAFCCSGGCCLPIHWL